MKQTVFKIKENIKIADSVYRMVLCGDTEGIRPGQFVNIKLEGLYLRRPISVCDVPSDGTLVIIYKVVGKGTELMSGMTEGDLDILTQLGNGYELTRSGDAPLLIGGGVGVPPMFMAAKDLSEAGKRVTVILGFNTKSEIFYENEFKALGADVYVATADGSYGTKGFVTDVMKSLDTKFSYFYTCGPEPMLRAVAKATDFDGEMSFEERMGCGFGACMGCSCKTLAGNKRICKDGPVMRKEEIIWND